MDEINLKGYCHCDVVPGVKCMPCRAADEIERLRRREVRSRRTLSVELQHALDDWKDAGAPVERVAVAIGNLVQAGIDFVIAEFDDEPSDSANGEPK